MPLASRQYGPSSDRPPRARHWSFVSEALWHDAGIGRAPSEADQAEKRESR